MNVTTESLSLTKPGRVPLHRETVAVGKRCVDFLVLGEGDPLVFLHGFGANPDIYLKSLVGLARRGRQVIAPALPSFGRSTPLHMSDSNVRGVAAHMVAALHEYDPTLGAVDFVGHSFGGGVSLHIAAHHPGLVKSLTLICPVGGAGEGAPDVHSIVRGIISGDAGKGWLQNGLRHFLPSLVRHAPGVVATGLSAWFSDQLADIEKVDLLDIPVRFVFAKDDHLVRSGSIPTRISDNIRVETQDGRHSWLIGETDRFVEVVLGPAQPTPVTLAG